MELGVGFIRAECIIPRRSVGNFVANASWFVDFRDEWDFVACRCRGFQDVGIFRNRVRQLRILIAAGNGD